MRPISTAALLALGLALGACGPVNRGLDSVNQPVVSRTDYVFDVRSGGEGLAYGEAERLHGWFESLGLGYGDRISVDDPTGGAAAREAVAQVAARYGLLLSDAPGLPGGADPGEVRVVVSRAAASVPDCPNWQRKSQPEFAGSTMSNYGCAVNSNLAAMVADPQDLVRGQATVQSDARTATKAIQSYREAEPTGKGGLAQTSTKGGK